MATDFTLPELGENIDAGDVLRVLVKPGDTVAKDQPVLELETDKATIEVPSTVAGQVKEIKVKAGDKVKVGQAILTVDNGGAPVEKSDAKPAEPARAPESAKAPEQPRAAEPARPSPAAAPQASSSKDKVVDFSRGSSRSAPEPAQTVPDLPLAPAAPSVRRMARELGVEIDQVPGSGPTGRISEEDVKSHAKKIVT